MYCLVFGYLSMFAFFCQYEACKNLHTMADRSKMLGERKNKPLKKIFLVRWFLALYGDKFPIFHVKRTLKILAGRANRGKHYRKGPRQLLKRQKNDKQLNLFPV